VGEFHLNVAVLLFGGASANTKTCRLWVMLSPRWKT